MILLRSFIKKGSVFCVQQSDSVQQAVQNMAEHKTGAVLVLDGDKLVGIFTERDLLVRVVAKDLCCNDTAVKDVMTEQLVVVDINDSYVDAMRKMKMANTRHLPVIENDRLVGVVSLRDLLNAAIDWKDEEIKWLTAYIHYVPPGKE